MSSLFSSGLALAPFCDYLRDGPISITVCENQPIKFIPGWRCRRLATDCGIGPISFIVCEIWPIKFLRGWHSLCRLTTGLLCSIGSRPESAIFYLCIDLEFFSFFFVGFESPGGGGSGGRGCPRISPVVGASQEQGDAFCRGGVPKDTQVRSVPVKQTVSCRFVSCAVVCCRVLSCRFFLFVFVSFWLGFLLYRLYVLYDMISRKNFFFFQRLE